MKGTFAMRCQQQPQQFGKRLEVKVFVFLFLFSFMQFDGEPGEMAKDACAEFCNHQKFALEQLKVCNVIVIWSLIPAVFNSGKAQVMLCFVTHHGESDTSVKRSVTHCIFRVYPGLVYRIAGKQ